MLRVQRNTATASWRCAAVAAVLCGAVITDCGGSAHRTQAARPSKRPISAATTNLAQPIRRLRALTSAAVPIDGPPLQAGLGAVWSASSSGLIELSKPAGKPTVVIHEPVDDVAVSATRVYALMGCGRPPMP
jgi:hypothetical protein